MIVSPQSLFCFGFGFSAAALANNLSTKGWRITGTTRNAEKQAASRFRLLHDHDVDNILDAAAGAAAILISSGPNENGDDPTLARHGEALGAAVAQGCKWIGYLSTTGVYGDHRGAWVDENTPVSPATKRGKARICAEATWRALGGPIHIFRLAGIYGPGRGPFEKIRTGKARCIVKPNQVFSRIHVADIAQVLEASINRPNPGSVYNVCDDEPAPPQDVIAFAADLLNAPGPRESTFDEARTTMSPMAVSFYAENKRVKNDKVKNELGITWRFPNYRVGLEALLQSERRRNR